VKRKRKIKILLAITISLLLPVLSAYTDYYILIEADILSQNVKFENTDLDCLQFFEKQKFTGMNTFCYTFSGVNNLAGHLFCLSYEVTFPQVKTSVLRC